MSETAEQKRKRKVTCEMKTVYKFLYIDGKIYRKQIDVIKKTRGDSHWYEVSDVHNGYEESFFRRGIIGILADSDFENVCVKNSDFAQNFPLITENPDFENYRSKVGSGIVDYLLSVCDKSDFAETNDMDFAHHFAEVIKEAKTVSIEESITEKFYRSLLRKIIKVQNNIQQNTEKCSV